MHLTIINVFQTVEKLDLLGLDYLWRVVTDVTSESIANSAIDYLLNTSFVHVSAKLKDQSAALHRSFIDNCYSRLESILSNKVDEQESAEKTVTAVQEGHELEVRFD